MEVVQDLNRRFELNRVVFVGDRGMMTIGNVEQLRKMQQGYLVGLQRRSRWWRRTSNSMKWSAASPI